MQWWSRIKNTPLFIKLLNWEYWPGPVYYWPLSPYFLYLAARAKHPCFFTAANPGIHTGGMGFESKYDTIQMLPQKWSPRTFRVEPNAPIEEVLQSMDQFGLRFPIIAKPDIGFRGHLVRKVKSAPELEQYLSDFPIPFLIQEFIAFPEEFGILYYRMPGESKGHITSITLKAFLNVIGDGRSTVRQLVKAYPRAKLQLKRLEDTHAAILGTRPAKGEVVSLGEIGNHSKGTMFISGNHLIDLELIDRFDQFANEIDGFNYGRFDIRATNIQDLKAGKNFKILEVNGVCSEPAHIYDPDTSSYGNALEELRWHWNLIRDIGVQNHKRGAKYLKPWRMIEVLIDMHYYFKKIKSLKEKVERRKYQTLSADL